MAEDYSETEKNILGMFWGLGSGSKIPTSPKYLLELIQQVRSKDVWLNYVLNCDRAGEEPWEVYCFSHGLPTRNCVSWNPLTDEPTCGTSACRDLRGKWQNLWERKHVTWTELLTMAPECSCCAQERKPRCQVHDGSEGSLRRLREDFAAAPYVHPYNQPK